MDPVSQQLLLLDLFINDRDDEAQGTLSVPSSVVTPNWEKWMTQQRMVLLSTGTSTSWKNELMGTSEAQQGEGQSLAPEEEQAHAPGPAGAARRETSVAEKDLGVLVGTRLNISQESVLVPKKVNGIQGCTGRSVSRRMRKVLPPLSSALVRPPLKC